jgi:hypothetical protein
MTMSKTTGKSRAPITAAEPAVAGKAKPSGRAASAPAKSASKAPAKSARNPATDSAGAAVTSAANVKAKLVRDSFTIPKSEYAVLEGLKVRAANLARPVKKSELLRAGVAVLHAMADKAFLAALNGVPSLKTGRPKGADATSVLRRSTK